MYDDAARGHWYDEPPYESDPDDFLMSGMGLDPAAASIQVSNQTQLIDSNDKGKGSIVS